MARGIELANYYGSEAMRLAEAGMTDPELLKARKLLDWLRDSWTEEAVSLPDIYRLGPSFVRVQKEAKRYVRILEDHGWLRSIVGGSVIRGRRRREAWELVKGDG